jgi:hypothetical protein
MFFRVIVLAAFVVVAWFALDTIKRPASNPQTVKWVGK